MKTKIQKKQELDKLKKKFSKSKIAIFTSFAREGEKGIDVSGMRTLKTNLRALNSEYMVEKKTILDKAVRGSKSEVDVFKYQGSLGVAFADSNEQTVAKTIYDFARKNPALKYFGAIWNGKFLDMTQFVEFAKLPSKEVMIARLLGMMKYPLSALAVALDQVSKKQSK